MSDSLIKSLFGDFLPPKGFVPLQHLGACQDENPDPIIEDVLFSKSFTLEHGLKETHKSWTAGYLAVCVASGMPFFGHKVVRPGKVVYVYGEGMMIRRLKMLCRGMGIEVPTNLIPYKLKCDLSDKSSLEDLKNHIPEDTVLIIIDNYEKYWSSHSDEKVVSSAVKIIQSLIDYAAILVVQHQPKNASQSSSGHKLAIGSSRLVNAADTTFELKRDKKITRCKIYHRETEPPAELKYTLNKLSEDAIILAEPGLADLLKEERDHSQQCLDRVIELLKAQMSGQKPYTITQIYDTFLKGRRALSTAEWYERISPRLQQLGFLVKEGNKHYVFHDPPLPEAS